MPSSGADAARDQRLIDELAGHGVTEGRAARPRPARRPRRRGRPSPGGSCRHAEARIAGAPVRASQHPREPGLPRRRLAAAALRAVANLIPTRPSFGDPWTTDPLTPRGLTRSDYRLFAAGAVLDGRLCARILPATRRALRPLSSPPSALPFLAVVVGRSVDGLGDRLGPGMTGVVQSALGNLPELFISVFALRAGLLVVVQSALVGSILANGPLGARHRVRRRWSPARDPAIRGRRGAPPLPSSSSWRSRC